MYLASAPKCNIGSQAQQFHCGLNHPSVTAEFIVLAIILLIGWAAMHLAPPGRRRTSATSK